MIFQSTSAQCTESFFIQKEINISVARYIIIIPQTDCSHALLPPHPPTGHRTIQGSPLDKPYWFPPATLPRQCFNVVFVWVRQSIN